MFQKFLLIFSSFVLSFVINSALAQSLTGLSMSSGISAVRHPISVGNQTLQQSAEKNISFGIKNITNSTLTRAVRLYMFPLPSGTPIIVWDSVLTFSPAQVMTFNRNNVGRLGTVVTQPISQYRLELRASNLPDVNTVTTVSPLIPGTSGTNQVTIRVIGNTCSASTIMLTQGIASTAYPVYIGPLNWLRHQEKNITFTLQNISNNSVTGAFKLYLAPLPSGTPILVWQSLVSFAPRQMIQFSRANTPELGNIVTENEGQYRLELRGSDIPDLNNVTPACSLVSGGTNPVIITIVDCNAPYVVNITPPGPVNICPGSSVTLTATANPLYRYQWRRNGVNIPNAVNNTYTTNMAGDFDVVVTKNGCALSYTTPVVKVNIFPVNASITGLNNQYTTLDGPVTMTGNPSGGTFSGNGVSGNTFSPQAAGIGYHTITYSGTDANGCTYSVTRTVTVVECFAGITIEPAGTVTICQGGTIDFSASNLSGYTYQWHLDGSPIMGAVNNTYTATQAGVYTIVASKPGCPNVTSNATTIVFYPQTVATISGLNAQYYDNSAPVTMTGTPLGGTFSGPGVSGNTFNPQVAGVGIHTITYAGTDANGCAYTVSTTVEVITDPCMNPVWWSGESPILHEHFYDVIDINHDGKKDVLTSRYSANPGKLNILFNNGNGFDPPVTLNTGPYVRNRSIDSWDGRGTNHHYQDFDNDGNMDLLVTLVDMGWCSYTTFRIYWGIPAFPYFDENLYTTINPSGSCSSIWAIDFDGDGDKDLYAEAAFATSFIYRNNGGRSFSHVSSLTTSRDVNFMVDDWNGDGMEDLIGGDGGYFDGDWGFKYYQSNGNGTFAPPIVKYAAEKVSIVHRIQADPLNNSQLDVMCQPTYGHGDSRWLYIGKWDSGLNDFVFTSQNVLPNNSVVLHAFDWNGDGFQDVITRQVGTPERIFVNYNDGVGNFAVQEQIFESTRAYPLFVDNLGTDCNLIFVKKTANDSIAILNARTNGIRYYRQASVLTETGEYALTLYPNPARETMTATFTSEKDLPVEGLIYDLSGRLIKNFTAMTTEGRNEIPFTVSDMTTGIYVLKLKIGDKEQVSKIAVE